MESSAAQDQNFTKISAGYQLSLHVISYKIKFRACGWQSVTALPSSNPLSFFFFNSD